MSTATGLELDGGTILIEDGLIRAVGTDLEVPDGAQVLDASSKWVVPGLIDAHTHISVKGEPAWLPSVSDITEITSPITPTMRAVDGLNPADRAIASAREAGFTTVCTLPGSGNLIGGQSVVFKTRPGRTVHDIVIDHPVQIKFALGENPKRIHGQEQKRAPLTRLGNASMLREVLSRAAAYAASRTAGSAPLDFQLEPLVPVVQGERTCRIHSHRADDIVTATRIAEEFGLRYAIDHATEGWKIADFLARKGLVCVVGPLDLGPDKLETWEARLDNPAILHSAGVTICLTQDGRSSTRFLPAFVGMAIAHGLPFEAALRAVTANPARLLGIDDRVGTIEAGKQADLAIFTGNPFSSLSRCERTIIDGVPQ